MHRGGWRRGPLAALPLPASRSPATSTSGAAPRGARPARLPHDPTHPAALRPRRGPDLCAARDRVTRHDAPRFKACARRRACAPPRPADVADLQDLRGSTRGSTACSATRLSRGGGPCRPLPWSGALRGPVPRATAFVDRAVSESGVFYYSEHPQVPLDDAQRPAGGGGLRRPRHGVQPDPSTSTHFPCDATGWRPHRSTSGFWSRRSPRVATVLNADPNQANCVVVATADHHAGRGLCSTTTSTTRSTRSRHDDGERAPEAGGGAVLARRGRLPRLVARTSLRSGTRRPRGHDTPGRRPGNTTSRQTASRDEPGRRWGGLVVKTVFECVRVGDVPPAPRPHRPAQVVEPAIVVAPRTRTSTPTSMAARVQFLWDREGKRDEHSTCWIRRPDSGRAPGGGRSSSRAWGPR